MATDPTGRTSHLPDFHRGVSWKQPVRVASTANGTLSTAFANGQTVDGIVLATGDRILLKDQTAGSANGIYTVAASGAPTRAFDFDQDQTTAIVAEESLGAFVYVIAGTANGGTVWYCTNTTTPILGTTALTFAQFVASSTFAVPAIVLGTVAAAGAATTSIRSDSTIIAFDATVPVTQAYSDAAAAGAAAVAARRDHRHGMPAAGAGLADQGVFTYLDGTVAAAPATPAAGKLRMYAKTGKVLAVKDDAGVETVLGAGGGAGALVFLEAHTASASATLDFTTFISSTYDTYKIEGVELIVATSAADLRMQVGTGAGPTYDTGSNYEWARVGAQTSVSSSPTVDQGSTGAGGRIFVAMANTAAYGFGTFSMTASGLQSTAIRKTFQGTQQYVTSAGPVSIFGSFGMQWTTSGTVVTALRFLASSGNITSGVIRIYGVSKS